MHRLIIEVRGCSGGVLWWHVERAEPVLARAIVCAVIEAEAFGVRVVGVRSPRRELSEATRLVLALRSVSRRMSEEELVLLLDLLPL